MISKFKYRKTIDILSMVKFIFYVYFYLQITNFSFNYVYFQYQLNQTIYRAFDLPKFS